MLLPPFVFENRRDRVKASLPDGAVAIVAAHAEVVRSRDSDYPFRQSSDFWYLTGFTEPDAVLILQHGVPDRLVVRPNDPAAEVWTGRRLGPERVRSRLGIPDAHPLNALDALMDEALANADRVEYPFDCIRSTRLAEAAFQRVRGQGRKRQLLSHRVDLGLTLHRHRQVKSPEEIDLMRKAGQISARGHLAAMRQVEPGMTEDQLASIVEHSFRMDGSPSVAYQTIVGGGENACILHYVDRYDRLRSGDLVLIDAGCEWGGYAGDITRTFPVNGQFSGAQRELYNIVLAAQTAALADVRPGLSIRAYHETAIRVLTQGLLDLKILTGTLADAIETKAYLPYYMHGTGHLLGLDVHDVGFYEDNGSPIALQPGMVVTVEPGLYISQHSDAPARYSGIGIRIEDDVVVTTTGHEVLSGDVPKDPDAIEVLMKDRC